MSPPPLPLAHCCLPWAPGRGLGRVGVREAWGALWATPSVPGPASPALAWRWLSVGVGAGQPWGRVRELASSMGALGARVPQVLGVLGWVGVCPSLARQSVLPCSSDTQLSPPAVWR